MIWTEMTTRNNCVFVNHISGVIIKPKNKSCEMFSLNIIFSLIFYLMQWQSEIKKYSFVKIFFCSRYLY